MQRTYEEKLEAAYATLGVSADASETVVRAAYRRLALTHHPDKNPGDATAKARFQHVSEAYKRITSPEDFQHEQEDDEAAGAAGFDDDEVFHDDEEMFAFFAMFMAEMMDAGMGGPGDAEPGTRGASGGRKKNKKGKKGGKGQGKGKQGGGGGVGSGGGGSSRGRDGTGMGGMNGMGMGMGDADAGVDEDMMLRILMGKMMVGDPEEMLRQMMSMQERPAGMIRRVHVGNGEYIYEDDEEYHMTKDMRELFDEHGEWVPEDDDLEDDDFDDELDDEDDLDEAAFADLHEDARAFGFGDDTAEAAAHRTNTHRRSADNNEDDEGHVFVGGRGGTSRFRGLQEVLEAQSFGRVMGGMSGSVDSADGDPTEWLPKSPRTRNNARKNRKGAPTTGAGAVPPPPPAAATDRESGADTQPSKMSKSAKRRNRRKNAKLRQQQQQEGVGSAGDANGNEVQAAAEAAIREASAADFAAADAQETAESIHRLWPSSSSDAAAAAAPRETGPTSATAKENIPATAASLVLSQRVTVRGEPGTVRFIGPVHYARGDFVGIELDDATGKNNGTVKGQTYFTCEEQHGLMVRTSDVTI